MSSRFFPQHHDDLTAWVTERHAARAPFQIVYGAKDGDGGDVLSLEAMKQIHFFEPDDMVIGVEPGFLWRDLRALLAEKGMWVPVNPWRSDTSVGALVDQNHFGADRMAAGGIRDSIIGVSYINGLGKQVKAGGRVVKNVTGYDVSKLVVGAQGGFGPLCSINFKMMPLPIDPHGLYLKTGGVAWCQTVQEEVLNAHLPLDWIACTYAEDTWRLGFGISGNPARQDRLVVELQKVFENNLRLYGDGEEPKALAFGGSARRLGGMLDALDTQAGVHLHATLPTASLLNKLEVFTEIKDARLLVHPMGGDLHLFAPEIDAQSLDMLRRAMAGSGGYLTLQRAPDALLESFGWSVPLPSGYPIMQALKRKLDPHGLFRAPFYEMV